MNNILDNLKHVNIVDKFVQVSKRKGKELSIKYVTNAVRTNFFPEYRDDPDLESKIKIIMTHQ